MTLAQIEQLINQGRYEEATDAGKDLLAMKPELKFEVARLRSYMFSRQAEYSAAIEELSSIIKAGEATLGDYDKAAFWALYDGQFHKALDWYLIALKMGEEQNETWFRSGELDRIAYIYMELGEYENAMSFLDKLESDGDDGPFLIPHKGFCALKQLRDEIRRRAADRK
jgi:tetratricopeptide (TPR) repeat protein